MKKIIAAFMALVVTLSIAAASAVALGSSKSLPEVKSITEIVSPDGGMIDIIYEGFENKQKSGISGFGTDNDGNLDGGELTELPSSYDSRTLGIVTSVKDQTTTGSCWAFSAMSALETDALKSGLITEPTDFSPIHLAYFTYTPSTDTTYQNYGEYYYPQSNKSQYEYGGNYLRATATLAQFIGINKFSTYPMSMVSNNTMTEEDRFTSDSGLVLSDTAVLNGLDNKTDAADVTEIKKWIMEHGSVTAGYFTDSTLSFENKETGATYCDINAGGTNHAITIIGWDDNYSRENFKQGTYTKTVNGVVSTFNHTPSQNGAWLVKNSWGTSYNSNGGYIWISYEDKNLMGSTTKFVGFTAQPNIYSHLYSYNAVGYTSYYPYNAGSTAKQANVFTADKNGKNVSAVTCYTLGNNVQATVSIYKNLPADYKKPTDGTKATEYTETLRYSGYHTIRLPQKVLLDESEIFSVVIELTSKYESFGIPIENIGTVNDDISSEDLQRGYSAGYVKFTSSSRQSYLYSGSTWVDTTTPTVSGKSSGNLYIQALSDGHEHHYVTGIIEGNNCQERNKNATYCDICGDIKSYEYAEGYGPHTYSNSVVEPTCQEKGYTEHKCIYCSDSYKDNETEKVDHSCQYLSTTAPTCQKEGYSTYKCKWCDYSYNSDKTTTVDHSCSVLSVTSPTCQQKGYTTYKCKWCEYTYNSDWIDARNHDCRVLSVVSPTCEEPGYSVYKCLWCDYTYNDTPTQATGHDLVKGELVSEDGTYFVYKYKCKNCDHTENQKIEKTFFQKVAYAFSSFFKSIGSFFRGLFS